MGSRVVRVDRQGLFEMTDGLTRPSQIAQRDTPVIFGRRVLGPDGQGLLVLLDGLGRTALVAEGDAQIHVGQPVLRGAG